VYGYAIESGHVDAALSEASLASTLHRPVKNLK